MRIGLVCPYDLSRPGGVQAQVKDLARHLSDAGDEVMLLGPGLPPDVEGVDLGSTVTVPGNRSRVPLSIDPGVGGKIRREAGHLDLLHIHEPFMPTVSLSALRTGPPVVATFHAAPGAGGTAFYTVFRSQQRRLLGPNVRVVTAVSTTAAAPLAEDLEVMIVPNGVDTSKYVVDVERRPHRVAFLGRDEKRKGLDVLLQAWEKVRQSVPAAELVVMGAQRSTPEVRWLGPVDDDQKISGLASSAIYVAPNLGGESFGVVLVEGMAAGCAVVASDLPSFRDVGDEAVRYFGVGDHQALAGMLNGLLGDLEAVESLRSAGRDRAKRFDWDTVAAEYRAVYERALS